MTDNEMNYRTVSQCVSSDWCRGYNEAVEEANKIINRQKAEIEKCENIIRLADKTIEKQSAEIERLNKQLVFEIESAYDRGMKAAVKEFAERLKEKIYIKKDKGLYFEKIDNLVKEMVGEG